MVKKHTDNDHASPFKKENEWFFLPNMEKIKYHSIIIYEIFNKENFNDLIEGLGNLYANLNPIDRERLEPQNIFKDELYSTYTSYLPFVSNIQFEGNVYPDRVFYNLGKDIYHLAIKIYQIMPSFAILEINAYLSETVSDELNEIIYTYQDERKETIETVNGKYDRIYSPDKVKEEQITALKVDLKFQLINFLSKYFKGNFFNLSELNISVVPSIDFFSLNYPDKDEEIIEWGTDNIEFFNCFKSSISQNTYRNNNYLFCEGNSVGENFNNYSIFATRSTSKYSDMYPDVDTSIVEEFNSRSFVSLAFVRWLKIEEQIIGKFNVLISEDIEYLEKNKLKSVIANRKIISKELFYFERLKLELKLNDFYFFLNELDFKSLGEKKYELSNDIIGSIKKGIEDIDYLFLK